jgi:hypothetical protein
MAASDRVAVCVVARDADTLHQGWRVLWYPLTEHEASKICSDPRTAGQNYMLVWCRESTFEWKWRWHLDDGQHDAVLDDLGITKPPQQGGLVSTDPLPQRLQQSVMPLEVAP